MNITARVQLPLFKLFQFREFKASLEKTICITSRFAWFSKEAEPSAGGHSINQFALTKFQLKRNSFLLVPSLHRALKVKHSTRIYYEANNARPETPSHRRSTECHLDLDYITHL